MTAKAKSRKDSTVGQTSARDDIAAAARVLRLEADGLQSLARGLDDRFVKALDLLGAISGRIVVTGMGKSGHVARKIAATLASTGAPALFVHPAEASHGDLGMIANNDAVLALSNSGDTPELADIIAHCRRYRIPLIAMTSGAKSALAESSDAALILPRAEEACPMGMAPTTSTTMMMALGDAIAIALLERRGFSAGDFQMLHPGGQLGRRLLKVSDIMHTGESLPLIGPDMPMTEAILIMTARSFGCVGVAGGDGKLLGIITDGDLRRHMASGLLNMATRDVMTPEPKTIQPQALAAEALAMMNLSTHPFTALFVVDRGKPIGIVHIHDCLRAGIA
ncbi:MAG: KpsF/GutQ family sugar-phosphate isomerase [Dongiaceae bacterium]